MYITCCQWNAVLEKCIYKEIDQRFEIVSRTYITVTIIIIIFKLTI